MNSDRIKEIQLKTAYPESVSIQQALLQVWNECQQEHNSQTEALKKEIEELKAEMLEMDKNIDNDYFIPTPIVKEFKIKVNKLIIDKSLPKIF